MPGLIDQGTARTATMDNQIFSAFSQKVADDKREVERIRREKGLSDDQCIHCGKEIEQGRASIGLPDCLKCHLERE